MAHKFSNFFVRLDSCCDKPMPKKFMDHINDMSIGSVNSDSVQIWDKIKQLSNGF
jgi:hypothetical protein